MSTKEALSRIIPMAKRVLREGKKVQVSVQSAFGCGYEGEIKKETVLDIVTSYLDAGLDTISLADTAGMGEPSQVRDLFGEILDLSGHVKCACHFHDTKGQGLANCQAALESGVTWFESAFGGLGGCPFTRTSSGNVKTEALIELLNQPINVQKIEEVSQLFRSTVSTGHPQQ